MISRLRSLPEGWKTFIQAAVFFAALWPWCAYTFRGFARWPYAPIREEAGRFLDKRGNLYSADDFHSFEKWQQTFYGGALICVVAFAVSWAIGKLLKKELPNQRATDNDGAAPRRV
jgi:hypothetical protein